LAVGRLKLAIAALVARHKLLGDDQLPLRVNLSRLRKSYFDRGLRIADGDLVVTANLMGNTPRVAGMNYPSMNLARQAEAADFMNEDYIALMRSEADSTGTSGPGPKPMEVRVFRNASATSLGEAPANTPVSNCTDTLHGQHAPQDGHRHCDRFVMCLFCANFAVVGTVDELWRLFSFQAFARSELQHLDDTLGPLRTVDEVLEDLRDRYRVAIPYIDSLTKRQFHASAVVRARAKTDAGVHPFWSHQMTISRRARDGRSNP
jgi:hypothetical protein